MTYVQNEQELIKYTGGVSPLVIETYQPWASYHAKSLILGNTYEGHVVLKIICGRNPKLYYIGNAAGLQAPIFLQDFNRELKRVPSKIQCNITVIVDILSRRMNTQLVQSEHPEILSIYHEKIAQRVMKYISTQHNILDYWVNMEIERYKMLLNSYLWDFESLKEIYEMVNSTDTLEIDMKNGYENMEEITIPDLDLFTWVCDILVQF